GSSARLCSVQVFCAWAAVGASIATAKAMGAKFLGTVCRRVLMVASPSEDEIKAVTRRPVTDVLVPARRGALKRRRFALYEGMGEQGVGLYNGCGIFFWLLANLNGCL